MIISNSNDLKQCATHLTRLEERYLLDTISQEQVLSALGEVELAATHAMNNLSLDEHLRYDAEILLNDALILHKMINEDEGQSRAIYSIVMAITAIGATLYVLSQSV